MCSLRVFAEYKQAQLQFTGGGGGGGGEVDTKGNA